MKKWMAFIGVLLFSAACSEEIVLPTPEVYEIREIGELSTTEYLFSKVIRVNDPGEWYKFGNRKILLSCKAKVKAGIDLTLIPKGDLLIEGKEISIELPAPKITSFNMDPNSVKTEVVDVDGFRSDFTQNDINKILQMGEKSIRESLTGTGIYKDAEKNAIAFVIEFYEQMGFEKVSVSIKQSDEK